MSCSRGYSYSWTTTWGTNSQAQTTVTITTSDGRKIIKTYAGNCAPSSAQVAKIIEESSTQRESPAVSDQAQAQAPAPAQTTPSEDINGFSQFEREALDAHNEYRAKHGCPPLQLNRKLCDFSKQWATHLASRNTLQHRQNSGYGENLYMSGGMTVTGATAVKAWYDEIKHFRFGSGGFSAATGHFTQVVWKNSKNLGIAFEKRGNSVYVVANYDPPGNYAGQFGENVPRPLPASAMAKPVETKTDDKERPAPKATQVPPAKSETSGEQFSQFELESLKAHNDLRARHGCPPLKLNRNLCNFSKDWARNLASRNTLQHRSNSPYGENLYMSSGMAVNGRTAVQSWYDEIKHYNFGSWNWFSTGVTGHFTQVVWKNSRELGVAIETRGSSTYVVANYDPPGNYSGQYAQNVPPPRS